VVVVEVRAWIELAEVLGAAVVAAAAAIVEGGEWSGVSKHEGVSTGQGLDGGDR